MAEHYLTDFPQPLLDDLVADRWLPIVGAGLSRNAVVPAGTQMPLWSHLGQLIARDLPDYASSGPVDALSAFEQEYGRPKLIEKLSELLFIDTARPGGVHKAFCSLPFDLVCTTNFDFLLERQHELMSRHCIPLINEDQLPANYAKPGIALLKLHGDLHHPTRLVVTEHDYDSFLDRFPLLVTFIASLLITRSVALIGYSLDDPDFRQIWQIISDRLGGSRKVAYSIMVAAEATDVARFERRGVKVVNLPGSRGQYGLILADAFTELRSHVQRHNVPASHGKEEKPTPISAIAANAPRVCTKDGNIYFYASPETESRQLTASGLDSHPCLSPDGALVAFVRSTPDQTVDPGVGDAEATELWTVRVVGTAAQMRVRGSEGETRETTLAGFSAPQFSPDGRQIYFLSQAWVTSRAVHVMDLDTGGVRFVCPGNSLEVILRGESAGHLMVSQHQDFLGGGSYDWLWLITPDGRGVGPIRGDGQQFRELLIPKQESPIVGSE
jgi:SIR2-like domain/WD40-like Beta Propeller Repeat